MNFLGMGPAELILIFIIALIVFGPGKLPELGQAIGKSIKEFRKMSQEFTQQVNLEAMTAELEEQKTSQEKPVEETKTEDTGDPEQEEQDAQDATENTAEGA
jgi:sec-independent protein translocase protein TatA